MDCVEAPPSPSDAGLPLLLPVPLPLPLPPPLLVACVPPPLAPELLPLPPELPEAVVIPPLLLEDTPVVTPAAPAGAPLLLPDAFWPAAADVVPEGAGMLVQPGASEAAHAAARATGPKQAAQPSKGIREFMIHHAEQV